MAETSVPPGKIVTLLDDWTKKLTEASKAAGTTLTISSAVVTATDGADATSETPTTDGTGVIFKFSTVGVTGTIPFNVTVTTDATLSNGDTDAATHTIQVTNT